MLAHVLRFAGQRAYTPYTSYGHSPVYALREAFNRLVEDNTDNLGVQMLASQALGFLHGPAPMFEDACTSCFFGQLCKLNFVRLKVLEGLPADHLRPRIV